jgi:PAS domain S-box-containing protein
MLSAAALATGASAVLAASMLAWALREQRRREEIETEKANFEAICQQSNDPLLVIDVADGRVHKANQQAARLLGWTVPELEARTLFQLHPPELIERSAEIIADAWEKGGLVYRELPLLTKDGGLLPVESSAKVGQYAGRPAIIIYARDIRPQLALEEQIQAKNAELERLNNQVRELFGRYVSTEVRDTILASGDSVLEGREAEITVLFCDLRGFTALSEKLGAKGTVEMLNAYFTEMVGAIRANHGTVDKFIGDAVMAVFGAPVATEAHAEYACDAALAMLRALDRFNAEQAPRLAGAPLKIGVGLATGKVIVGNLGSSERLEYTVVGPTVNLASRLESLTKEKKTAVLACHKTYEDTKSRFRWKAFEGVEIRGVSEPVSVYGLEGRG